jgi:multicomponent Na+:H+ antiporter subunit B
MANRIVAVLIIAGLAVILFPLVRDIGFADETPELAQQYIDGSRDDLGAANVVTAIVVAYRGLDTLGEVTVLFAATAGVGFVITRRRRSAEHAVSEGRDVDTNSGIVSLSLAGAGEGPSEILRTASSLLSPILLVLGAYIFTHGHLTPGGGFQGGVVVTSAVILSMLGAPERKMSHGLMTVIESLSGAAYVAIGILGIVLVAGFLDPTFLPMGEFGQLFSAGAIPIIYSVVGLKVGTELVGVVDRLRSQEEM